jgi:methionine-rich copper-binding protein CopC
MLRNISCSILLKGNGTMRPFQTAITALAAAVGLLAGSAQAHPKLLSATPAVGGEVSGAPTQIRMSFSEGIFPKFSGVALTDAAGHKIATGPAATAPGDIKQMIVPITASLAAGAYTVAWHAVSTDTHRVQGRYSFTVK